MANVGVGLYEGATSFPNVSLYLVHRNGLAPAIRATHPQALIGLRADIGKDESQLQWNLPANEAADIFVDQFIIPAVQAAGVGVYSFCLGPNEYFSESLGALLYRATAETRIMRRVQYGERMPDWWKPLAYAWGGIAVGHIEPSEVALFRDLWLHAWAVNYHGYLGPSRKTILQETDPYYLWRPLLLWVSPLRKLGWISRQRRLRIFLGECGPMTVELLAATERAQLSVDIQRAYANACPNVGQDVEFVGSCGYGFHNVGDQKVWRLDGHEDIFEQAALGESPPTQPVIIGVTPMKLSEQYPIQYSEWIAAGGDLEGDFRAHLVGIGTLLMTETELDRLKGRRAGTEQQIENVARKLGPKV